jgi:hypothetical protein
VQEIAVIVQSTSEALELAERRAREEDEDIRKYFKSDPLFFFSKSGTR